MIWHNTDVVLSNSVTFTSSNLRMNKFSFELFISSLCMYIPTYVYLFVLVLVIHVINNAIVIWVINIPTFCDQTFNYVHVCVQRTSQLGSFGAHLRKHYYLTTLLMSHSSKLQNAHGANSKINALWSYICVIEWRLDIRCTFCSPVVDVLTSSFY